MADQQHHAAAAGRPVWSSLAARPLYNRTRTTAGSAALQTAHSTLHVSQWHVPRATEDIASIVVVELSDDYEDEGDSWAFAMPVDPHAAMWHALTHIFRRTGMPHTVTLPGISTLYTTDFAIINPLIYRDWGRLPPTIAFGRRAGMPAAHQHILDGVAHLQGAALLAALPPGYISSLHDMPGPPIPAPHDAAAVFYAAHMQFEDTQQEVGPGEEDGAEDDSTGDNINGAAMGVMT
jgi:hypothetical protein